MLDGTASLTQITLRPLSHVKVADNSVVQTKFYKFETLLGQGTFGTVMRATELKSGTKWAIKMINKAQSGPSRLKLFQREISILRAVHHPHIIYLERVFESPKCLYLVFELCLCELREVFEKKKLFTEEETRRVIASLASAVTYLHNNDIVHRDLKLENILVTTNPNDSEDNLFIKVTDFGLSVVRGGVGQESMLQELCGTPAYMSPELFGERMYSQQCDVWAMGVIMYLLLTGNFPFEARAGKTLAQVVQSLEPDFNRAPFKNEEDSSARRLLRKMLQKNPAYRATANEVEKDPWTLGSKGEEPTTKNAMELMRLWRQDLRMSCPDPDPRAGRLSLLMDGMPRATDERARNAAIRKTFGETTGSASSAITSQRRRSSLRDPGAAQGAEDGRAAKSAAGQRRVSSGALKRAGGGREVRLSVIEEQAETGGTSPAAREGGLRPTGTFGVVGRLRVVSNQSPTSDTTSTVNLMPASKAPPIVYYEHPVPKQQTVQQTKSKQKYKSKPIRA